MHGNCCVCHVKLFKQSVCNHYSVDFLVNIVIRLLGQVYHFSLLISYPCSLVTHGDDLPGCGYGL